MYIRNPQPGTKVQCPTCYDPCVVMGRGQHRWIDCNPGCDSRVEWHEDTIAAGVVCNCTEGKDFCPMHGKTKKLIEVK